MLQDKRVHVQNAVPDVRPHIGMFTGRLCVPGRISRQNRVPETARFAGPRNLRDRGRCRNVRPNPVHGPDSANYSDARAAHRHREQWNERPARVRPDPPQTETAVFPADSRIRYGIAVDRSGGGYLHAREYLPLRNPELP
ncbi:hypothetical protein AYI68_g5590 [Smittium mucronatum]|uniref:Uncharacterized protein n=1 Tax=Smittium mucronatum TaxID=133383 RepID=A0A1R0GTV6_9FUNG|nr:hypothetical protein AYI68_g7089 [Smittium mucronatum]OLY80315.1 hypothetical protein AYI68_g5590 [Smittium mucronatum]